MIIIKGRILAVIFLILITLGIYSVYKPKIIDIKFIAEIESHDKLTGDWWFTVTSQFNEDLKTNNLTLPNIDFNKNNLLISGGRKIKSIQFKKSNKFPYINSHFAEAVLSKEIYPYTWFVYKIDKLQVYRDERGTGFIIED